MKFRVVSWTLAILCGFAGGAAAQQGTSELRGRVIDSQGGALPGVTVTVRNQETGMFRETLSNADGTYFVSSIVPGTYEITAELQGFKKYSRGDIRLEIGRTTSIDVSLDVGSLEEVVTVRAESPILDLTSKEVGGTVTARELVDLPSINRNYIGFVGLLPGIIPSISNESFGSDSISVNGLDARSNTYLLDGGNNNDDAIGQRAGTQTRTPLESIQEFQVLTNQFDAEFGRSTGAVVNAVTKSGTNRFRGSAFTYFQDAALTEIDFFAKLNELEKPDTSRRELGGTLGGPILRDRAHFFASVERVLIDEGVTVNIVPRPDLNATATEQTRVWNTIGRFDHQINASNTWGVRWLREDSPQFNQLIGDVSLAAAREESDTDQTLVAMLNSVLSNSKANTIRLSWTREDVAFANPCFNGNGRNQADCPPTLNFQSFTDQQNSVAQDRINDAIQFENTLSWFIPGRRGDHDIKTGVQYQFVQVVSNAHDNMNGTFSFGTSDVPFDPANPFTYPDRLSIRVPGIGSSVVKAHYVSGFVQDKWKTGDRLTLTLGLRYDLEVLPTPGVDLAEIGVIGESPRDTNNLQPRFGFAYDFAGDGRTVVRGGYGIFYDKSHFDLGITALFTNGLFSESFTANFPTNAADSGPRNGSFPTHPLLANGPTVDRTLLAQMFPAGTRLRNAGGISVDNPDRKVPQMQQITAGIERQLATDMSVSADYVHGIGRDMFMTRDLNAGLRALPVPTSPLVRQHRDFHPAAINQLVNVGEMDYDALLVQLEKRFNRNYSARVSYTLSYARGNTPAVGSPTSTFQVLDDLNLDLNEGPTNVDRRHNFVISGTALVPRTGGLTVSWVARALSGSPFTLSDSRTDADRNGNQGEPLPEGTYSGTGDRAISVEHDGRRNGAYGPAFFQADVRIGYRLPAGDGRTLDLFGEIYNLTNRTNYGNPNGNIASSAFLVLNGYRDGAVPRTGQIGVRFAF